MKEIQHSIEINASKEKIWEILWGDQTFRDWANIIDEGTYYTGELQEGNEINFIGSSDGGASYGVSARVEKLIPNEYILFNKTADIIIDKDEKITKRDEQWTGGNESYELEENNDVTKLIVTEDIPEELLEYFDAKIPEVLKQIKILSET